MKGLVRSCALASVAAVVTAAVVAPLVVPLAGPAPVPSPALAPIAALPVAARHEDARHEDARHEDAPWVWPTGTRVVERPWEAPDTDYSAGHRGIDVAAALGTPVVAVDDGTVSFAGQVAGRGVVTIDHGSGLVSTVDSVTPAVTAGQVVTQGSVVGAVAVGHCPARAPCLHLGARVDDRYVDPTPYLPPADWPVLLPETDWPG